MGHTVVGTFQHSGDADLAAAHLQEEYTLNAQELDVIGPAEWDKLTRPAEAGPTGWVLAALTGIGLEGSAGDEDPVAKRWGHVTRWGSTLVVARTFDPDNAVAIAHAMRESGAEQVDLLPH